jgi:predicted aminopeptidase
LPDNASYTRYAQLQRPFAVWNVVAAPAYSLEMHQWCFPITGCIAYRGYFSKSDAQAQALTLQSQGLETSVYGVPAYSTLGYLNWLGGDPLLSTFTSWQEGDFAGLLFHELAHQLLYVKNDTAFNESFATTVERMATPLWLHSHASAATQQRWQQSLQRRELWQQLTRKTRQRLQQIYEQKIPKPLMPKRWKPSKAKYLTNSAPLMRSSERNGLPPTSPADQPRPARAVLPAPDPDR